MFFHPSVLVMYLCLSVSAGSSLHLQIKQGLFVLRRRAGVYVLGTLILSDSTGQSKGQTASVQTAERKSGTQRSQCWACAVKMCVCLNKCLHACIYASYISVRSSSNWMSNPEISHGFILFWYIYYSHMHAKLIFFIFMQPFYLAASVLEAKMLQSRTRLRCSAEQIIQYFIIH